MTVAGKKTKLWQLALLLLGLLGSLTLVRHFYADLFWIPSGSMEPSVLAREMVFASKTAKLQRGQVAVLKSPVDPNMLLLKRVVALEGDHLKIDPEAGLIVNGEVLTLKGPGGVHEMWQGARVNLRWEPPFHEWEISVPEGHFVTLGDNRSSSIDSRQWGAVPSHHHLGQAEFVLWSCGDHSQLPGCSPSKVRWDRFLKSLRGGS